MRAIVMGAGPIGGIMEFTLGHVVRESARLGLSTPLCDKLLAVMLELESGRRPLGPHNYVELADCRA